MKGASIFLLISLFLSCSNSEHENHIPIRLNPELTIAEIHSAFEHDDFNSEDLVRFYLKRIDSLDKNGPELNSIISLNPDAIELAAALDKTYSSKGLTGALHGIPILLKDNIETGEGTMPCTAGALVMQSYFPEKDAPIVKQLKDAGAIILGKSNLSEWANFHSNVSSSGWSALGGQTKNPYKLKHNPCGSSAGSGAAVSAGFCTLALGTETNGSIMCPSNNNGIVGIKPTVGLSSRTGIIPISKTQDTSGPMARSVSDAVIALGTMTAADEGDNSTLQYDRIIKQDYTPHLRADGIAKKRIGYYSLPLSEDSTELTQIMRENLNLLNSAGAEIIRIDTILSSNAGYNSFMVLLHEFKTGLNTYFESRSNLLPISSLQELIDTTFNDPSEMIFDHELLKLAQGETLVDKDTYLLYLDSAITAARKNGIDRIMDSLKLDAIVAPTGSPAWQTDLEKGDDISGVFSSSPAAIAGYPNITVPMGQIDGLPVGISFFGRKWSEAILIEIAYGFEQKSHARISPKFKN